MKTVFYRRNGLGKTVQTVAFFILANLCKKTERSLFIASRYPLYRHGKKLLKMWAPDVNCVYYLGNGEARKL